MVNWKALQKRIPPRVYAGKKVWYQILWVDSFEGDAYVGLTSHTLKQITIKKGMSPKQTVLTYLHEIIHMFSDEADIKVTEAQVQLIESVLHLVLKSGNVFISKGKRK